MVLSILSDWEKDVLDIRIVAVVGYPQILLELFSRCSPPTVKHRNDYDDGGKASWVYYTSSLRRAFPPRSLVFVRKGYVIERGELVISYVRTPECSAVFRVFFSRHIYIWAYRSYLLRE